MLGLHNLRYIDPRAVVAHFSGVASLVAGSWYLLRGPGGVVLRETTAAATAGSLSPGVVTVLMLFGVGITGTIGQISPDEGVRSRGQRRGLGAGAQPGSVWVWFRSTRGLAALQSANPRRLALALVVAAAAAWLLA